MILHKLKTQEAVMTAQGSLDKTLHIVLFWIFVFHLKLSREKSYLNIDHMCYLCGAYGMVLPIIKLDSFQYRSYKFQKN